jgi:hypothetical protein
MAYGVFGRAGTLGFDRVRRTKKHPVPNKKSVWGTLLDKIFSAGAPKRHLGSL